MASLEKKIDAALLNSNGVHEVMRSVMDELKQLRVPTCDVSIIEDKSIQSASSLSSFSCDSSENSGCTYSSFKRISENDFVLTQTILRIIAASIKGLGIVTTLTRWHNNHQFLADKKNLSAKRLNIFYKITLDVKHVKNLLDHDEPKHKDYDEDCVTCYQLDVKNCVEKSCAEILAYFCKVRNKKTVEHPKLSKFLIHAKYGSKIFK